MGFVTESQTRADYTSIFYEDIEDTEYKLIGYLTPKGILIEIVKETMDSQSVNEELIVSKLIERRRIQK